MRIKSMRLTGILLALCLLISTAGSAWAANQPATHVEGVVKALGASPGGVGFMLLTGMFSVVKKSYPQLEMTVVPGGFVGNLQRVNTGEGDLGSTTTFLAAMAQKHVEPFNKGELKDAMALVNIQNQFFFFAVVRKDLEAESLGDLFAKKLPVRLCTLNKGTSTELVWRGIFASKGVSWEDVSSKWGGGVSFVAWADAVNLVKDGHADGILAVGDAKMGWIMELANSRDIKVLKWDPEFMKVAEENYGLQPGEIPAGSYPGIDKPVAVPYSPNMVVVNRNVPNNVVKAILKAMYDHAAEYAAFHPGLAKFDVQKMGKGMYLPLHPGAAEFYKEHNIPIQ